MKVIFEVLLFTSLSIAQKIKIISDIDEDGAHDFDESLQMATNIRYKRDAKTDYENSICECIPYYQCNYNGTINEYGQGIIDIRSGVVEASDNPMSSRKKCDHYLYVCCLPPDILPEHKSIEQNPDEQNGNNQGKPINPDNNVGGNNKPSNSGSGRDDQNTGGAGRSVDTDNKSDVEKSCGYRNSNGISFKITGNLNHEANFGEFPWMVAVMKAHNINGNITKVYQCGGSLINMRVILTAAHCVSGLSPQELSVRAGEWDTQTDNEPLPNQDREVSVVSIHPAYQKDILHNDFALLIVSQPFKPAPNVQTTCLPSENANFEPNKCFATGWGKSQFGVSGRFQVILKSVELSTVSHDSCQSALRNTRLGKYFKLHESFICAGGTPDADTCTGDGGSPLVCSLPDDPLRYVQVGIVAWGIACGQNNTPGVYANVMIARRWIDSTLMTYNILSDSYSYSTDNKNFGPLLQ